MMLVAHAEDADKEVTTLRATPSLRPRQSASIYHSEEAARLDELMLNVVARRRMSPRRNDNAAIDSRTRPLCRLPHWRHGRRR